ncbi:uncharacterized protein F5891DRAFT_1046705 [Suillus fuscotomentosus]|uniref:Uncharacterized protein n=1 Tax=Suillus fuscotomentosus TaxID=1912939 RepID=A0AAD4E1B1_9AGAM|nr:uncharacterized protein F5891DRAFT_1046705 [Suillus fuscotomentosus]KAG1897908.1 hypothetical protein F5891DRAFT_1046705 [Suillus fuscotomentosus]
MWFSNRASQVFDALVQFQLSIKCVFTHSIAALPSRPLSSILRSFVLNNLAFSLRDRWLQQGITFDLDEAIEHNRAALGLLPRCHSNRVFVFVTWSINSLKTDHRKSCS